MELSRVVEKYRPDFAFAYGSGAMSQEGYSEADNPMIDFIFAVNSPLDWHKRNLQENPADYSLLARALGEDFIAKLQQKGAGVYYNPYIGFEGRRIKYGVISVQDLLKDLEAWNSLYVGGRLHKPVVLLKQNPALEKPMKTNLEQALNVSLFLLPQRFSESELYETIAGISYIGDSRMRFGENPRKVKNIVKGNFERFRELYWGILHSKDKLHFFNGLFLQDLDQISHIDIYAKLPESLKSIELFSVFISSNERFPDELRKKIAGIVYRSSVSQSFKGILSAGAINSIKYAAEKLKKAKA